MADAAVKPAKPRSPAEPASAGADSASARRRSFAMLSDRGRVRHANQDACAAEPELGAFVVCDGMGGAAAGEVASLLAAEAFLHALSRPGRGADRRMPPRPLSADPVASERAAATYPADHPHTRLSEAMHAANQAVFRHARKSPRLRGMGTTLVAALWDDSAAGTLWLAHVGDSRCYRLRRGVLELLTQDHSLVEAQVCAGMLSRVQAAASPMRNIITRAVGSEPAVEPEIAAHATRPGDVYLLATDGLSRELDDEEIACTLAEFFPPGIAPISTTRSATARSTSARTTHLRALDDPLEAACRALVDAANAHGGRDNVTVLLLACP